MHINQKGQVLLTLILVMVIALTVGLSVAVRTTTNIRITGEEEDSQRAFSAAEAGIERSLGTNPTPILTPAPFVNNSNYSTAVSSMSGTSFVLNNGVTVLKDEPVDVWLSDYSTDPAKIYLNPRTVNLTVSWDDSATGCTAGSENSHSALEVIVITTTSPATPKTNNSVATYVFDPCPTPRRTGAGNQFSTPVSPGDTIPPITGKVFQYKTTTIAVTNGLIARIIPLYSPAIIGVSAGGSSLPPQGLVISSVGKADNTTRKIVSFRGYPKLPVELFPFIFFSPNPNP